MSNPVLIAVIIIFISALISLYLQSRRLDVCLKAFQDFHVTLEEKDGDVAWGRLQVYRTGIELLYREPNIDEQGHIETSYILYREQFSSIHAIYRYAADLSDDERRRRREQVQALVKRAWITRFKRRLRNLMAMLKDALMQTIGIVLGQAKKAAPGSVVLRQHEKEIKTISKEVIGHVGNAFEPILEKYIGRRVVLEITREGVTTEHVGILRDYSSEFLEVLDITDHATLEVPVYDESAAALAGRVELRVQGRQIVVHNQSGDTVYVRAVKWDGAEHEVDVVIKSGLEADFGVPEPPPKDAKLVVEIARKYDIVVPRTHAIIRHSAEAGDSNWKTYLRQLLKDEEEEEMANPV